MGIDLRYRAWKYLGTCNHFPVRLDMGNMLMITNLLDGVLVENTSISLDHSALVGVCDDVGAGFTSLVTQMISLNLRSPFPMGFGFLGGNMIVEGDDPRVGNNHDEDPPRYGHQSGLRANWQEDK